MRHRLAIVCLATGLAGCSANPLSLLDEATNAASQTACTAQFVSHVSPQDALVKELLPEPGMGAIGWALNTTVDRDKAEARSTIAGGFASRAVYREGRGCTLVHDDRMPAALKPSSPAPQLLPEIAGPEIVHAASPALAAAVDAAFDEQAGQAPRATAAVVVVHGGRVIAERYAPGYGIDTPLSGHSIAKSVVNALIGVLVREGRLDVTEPAAVPEWRGDARAAITLDNLLRMDEGFGFDEGGGPSIATHMWYTQADTAHFAAGAALLSPPGQKWGYSSRAYTVLSRIVGDSIGGGPQGVSDFAHREIFDPLGMRHVTIHFDQAGTMQGAWSVLATPRDWARFGLLYLSDGVAAGHRILPGGWVHYSTTPTLATGYGAGFWLNQTDAALTEWDMRWGIPGAPTDAFMARGYMGQYIVIVPSRNLVIVRFGFSHGPGADIAGVGRLVHDVIATLPAEN
ncbi:MAG TPA: serine hydrolase [Rhizomicrobium sp.]|nr:serine hydrolase [Rhizomicrobium sp.]